MNDIITGPIVSRPADRLADVHGALRLEWITLAWMTIEAGVAIGTGIAAHSLVLEAFGADSIIELLSAGVLVWRLRVELLTGASFPEHVERRASRIGGALLFALSLCVAAGGIRALWRHEGQDFAIAGLLVTGVATPVMYALARSKRRLADRLGSGALRADAVESLTCGYLSVVVFAALLAQRLFGTWWLSGISALALMPFLLREAREAWEGDTCGCD